MACGGGIHGWLEGFDAEGVVPRYFALEYGALPVTDEGEIIQH